jgi:hypothetical protein
MTGLPSNLPLKLFRGARVVAVQPLENITYFVLERPAHNCGSQNRISIGVESTWQLTNAAGDVVAAGVPLPGAGTAHLDIVGCKVVSSVIDGPSSFSLNLTTGLVLGIFVRDDGFESFSIPEANVYF